MSIQLIDPDDKDKPQPLIVVDAPTLVSYMCLNGPCQGNAVDAPSDATTGTACAIPWRAANGQARYAVYVLVDYNGAKGLMFLTSHHKPEYAQSQVQRITALCAAGVS